MSRLTAVDGAKALVPTLAAMGVAAALLQGQIAETAPRPSVQAMESQALAVFRELQTPTQTRKDEDGTVTIIFNTGTTTGYLYQYLDSAGKVESLRLNVGYEIEGTVDPKKLNAFNEKRRFGKGYTDSEGDAFLVTDLDVQFGSNAGVLRAWIIRFRALVPLFEREVFGG